MTQLVAMQRVTTQMTQFGRDYLQNRIVGEFMLARHIGIIVESADDNAVVLRAPLALNANYKGTAFGGSLYSVAVLTGWAWVTRYLAAQDLAADAVIQESNVRFLAPVLGELRASAAAPRTTWPRPDGLEPDRDSMASPSKCCRREQFCPRRSNRI